MWCCRKFLALVFYVLLAVQSVAGQAQQYFRFTHTAVKDPAISNGVYNIFQDRTGFLWFCSVNSVTRFDGYNYKTFQHDPNDTTSLPQGIVVSMAQDENGDIWAASQLGLSRYDPSSQSFKKFSRLSVWSNRDFNNAILELLADKHGFLWATTRDQQLLRFDIRSSEIRVFNTRNLLSPESDPHLVPMFLDRNNDLWVGFNRYNRRTGIFEPVAIEDSQKPLLKSMLCMCEDGSGNVWIGTETGLIKYDISTHKLTKPGGFGTSKTIVAKIEIDKRQNIIWAYASNKGLYRLDQRTGQLSNYTHDPYDPASLSTDLIYTLYCDKDENLWIATENGIDKLSRLNQHFHQYRLDPLGKSGIISPILRSIFYDNAGSIWLGTRGGGLIRMPLNNSSQYRQYLLEPLSGDYGSNFINCIEKYDDERLLLGTSTGLYIFNRNTGKTEKHLRLDRDRKAYDVSLEYAIWTVLKDTGHCIWIGTQSKGLLLYNENTRKVIHLSQEAKDRHYILDLSTWRLFRDRENVIWGCAHDGIYRFKRNSTGSISFVHYREDPRNPYSFKGEDAWYIHQDENGMLWIATLGGGLNCLDKATGKFHSFSVLNGLPSNEICAILEDRKQRLWISTMKGLCLFDKKTGKVLNTFTEADGLQGDHFGFGVCLRTPDGEMFFGGQNGLNSFYAENIEVPATKPGIAITAFTQSYKDRTSDLLKDSALTLDYDQNSISFQFAALDFTDPDKNQFRYYLEGVDDGWSPPTFEHMVSYNYLPPGKYIFHLMGGTNAYSWSKPIAFAIHINAPLWQQWWFKLFAFIIACGIAALLFLAYVRQQKEKRKRLESDLVALRAQLNPHFIFNSLTSLQVFITEHKEILALDYLSRFATLIRMILNNSRHPLISIADEVRFLELYTYMEAVRLQNHVKFNIEIDKQLDVNGVKLPPMLVQPLIENSLKHGLLGKQRQGIVNILFRADTHYVYCSVKDNGVGLNKAEENKQQRFIAFPSVSTFIIKERLEMLKDERGNRGSLTIQDIIIEGKVCGAKAELKIPKHIKLN